MAYCGPRGIPYRFFLGGKHRWTGFDRAAAQAWAEREADRCPGCGLHRSDLPANPRDPLPVEGAHFHCRGCEAKHNTKHPAGMDEDKRQFRHFFWRRAEVKAPRASRRRR